MYDFFFFVFIFSSCFFFFFKQKTAYEIYQCDWSSDVCSSDLSFWREQFSRCIRCYACREVCPMCFCRDVCIMQTQIPRWAGGAVDAKQSEMIQLIRVNHLAGRCTGCGECERACPVGIPLMLLLDEQNHAIEEMFAYGAGASLKARPPLLVFDVNKDIWGKG